MVEANEPTTWRITPAGATEEMIEAGANAMRDRFPYMSEHSARGWAALIWDAMSRARPAPPPVSPWMPIDDGAKTGEYVLLARHGDTDFIVARWVGGKWPWMCESDEFGESAWTLYQPIVQPPIEEERK